MRTASEINDFITTSAICKRLGISRQRVWQIATNRGIKPLMIGPSIALWSVASVALLSKRGKPGRPKAVAEKT